MRAMSLGVNAVGLTKCKACGARLNLLVAELALLCQENRGTKTQEHITAESHIFH